MSAPDGDPMGDLVLRDFPGPGCPVLFPLELAVVFGLFCTGAESHHLKTGNSPLANGNRL